MKIVSAKSLGFQQVYDLSIEHQNHSFLIQGGFVAHNCAYVVSDTPIKNFIPLTSVGDSKVRITQYTASWVEAVGGLKMDFLGVNSLKDIQEAVKLIQKRHGYEPKYEIINGEKVPGIEVVPHNGELLNLRKLPEDQDVFKSICYADTDTVFQFGSEGAKGWLGLFVTEDGQHALRSIEDLATFTALDRPGGLDVYVTDGKVKRNMLEEFAHRAKGGVPVGNISIFDEMFPETRGVLTYQENLTRAFKEIGNTTALEAERFREHTAKKKMAEVLKDKAIFMPGATKRLGEEEAERIWEQLEAWARYGFNKSHAVCYAMTGYACAWLKYHYPLEWWTAVLRHADKAEIDEKFWKHCGHYVQPPDIKVSENEFTVHGKRIIAPLSLLNGVGEKAHQELCDVRPVKDLRDFCQKIYEWRVKHGTQTEKGIKLATSNLRQPLLIKMIISGVLDGLFPETSTLSEKIMLFVETQKEFGRKIKKEEYTDFFDLSEIKRYQVKKSIFPFASADLYDIVLRRELPPFLVKNADGRLEVLGKRFIKGKGMVSTSSRLLRGADMDRFSTIDPSLNSILLEDRLQTACLAHITATRRFVYQKSKEAMEVSFEVDNFRFNMVKWPNKDGELEGVPEDFEAGAIAVLVVSRFTAAKPPSINGIHLVEAPLKIKDKKETSN